ncbi:uncharacterized protein LOC110020814 isoform X2 [Phalaenopsis equestris]|uniref:uncharacterized protein LOC110020814 isoform X2 n=1 Tax=Phalaenopsis equestris TaxID=78828 RepID=UPI0009E580E8|nr:uncharacterized protein LOC110020814 isoform X2 [Phalaenopsis equestris]
MDESTIRLAARRSRLSSRKPFPPTRNPHDLADPPSAGAFALPSSSGTRFRLKSSSHRSLSSQPKESLQQLKLPIWTYECIGSSDRSRTSCYPSAF